MAPYYIGEVQKLPKFPKENLHEVPLTWMCDTIRRTVLFGGLAGAYDVASNPEYLSILGFTKRVLYYSLPMAAMAAAYTSITFISQDLRGKDSPLNHALGASAAGGILHVWKKNVQLTHYGTILMMLGAVAYQQACLHGVDNLWEIPNNVRRSAYELYIPDFSLVQERKGWTT